MVRQLPPGFALVIRGGCAPVIARLPRVWDDRAYRRARRHGHAAAAVGTAPAPQLAGLTGRMEPVRPQDMPPDPFPAGTTFPWS
jgi:hypothetical protein